MEKVKVLFNRHLSEWNYACKIHRCNVYIFEIVAIALSMVNKRKLSISR